ncbi:MAG: alpha/beta hydrolase-fold protein, partial [Butyrivibrio sp.]|nr:alpha/beta hydrolase-fold protein [Butyrivibrio sp.]
MFYLKSSGIEIYNPGECAKTLYFLAAERLEPVIPPNCCVVMVYPYDWTEMMTPWAHSGRGMEKTGGGAEFAEAFEADLISQVEPRLGRGVMRRGIAGYSLGGLEALYMATRMKCFAFAGSVSGSLWYKGAAEYFLDNPLDENIYNVYMSLG